MSIERKKTVSKIKQNLFWAFAYNTGLIPIAGGILVPFMGGGIFGWLPIFAGLAMAMSSITVVELDITWTIQARICKCKTKEEIYTNEDFKQAYSL